MLRLLSRTILTLLSCVFLSVPAPRAKSRETIIRTDDLFGIFQHRVYQIRVIDKTTGKKSTIGSGFSVRADGLFATNYHVVSEAVAEPKRFRLEFVAGDGGTGPLRIIDVDVVHDLALVSNDGAGVPFFALRDDTPRKGSRIFSMGNPLDLGMTIVEGTYNGFIEGSLYEKILFSGSLNPGMSGGPAIDASGAVIGVNVSTAGNEISFLVPSAYLRELIDGAGSIQPRDQGNFTKRIERQLFENQKRYMGRLLSGAWKQDTLGECLVPREMGNIFKCWGETDNDSEKLYTVSSIYCANSDDIYLSPELTTGSIEFSYRRYEATRLGGERLYRVVQEEYADAGVPNGDARADLEEPRCNTRFVRIGGADWKTTICSWRYKKYPLLHDVVLKMALVQMPRRSMVVDLQLLGVSTDMALSFCKKFMGALQWRN